jgi:dihydrofolate reductase
LPNREANIGYKKRIKPKCRVAKWRNSIEGSVEIALQLKNRNAKVFIIGGENIYRQTIDKGSRPRITLKVHASPEGYAFLPELSDGKKLNAPHLLMNEFDFDVICTPEHIKNATPPH